jgi:hypothetical protein
MVVGFPTCVVVVKVVSVSVSVSVGVGVGLRESVNFCSPSVNLGC